MDMPLVLQWRSSEFVSRFMISDVSHDLATQEHWFNIVSTRSDCHYWIVDSIQGHSIGVINLTNINEVTETAEWAFYVGDMNFANLGGMIPPYLYNHVFANTPINNLIAEVVAENNVVLKLHALHGYVEDIAKQTTFTKDGQTRILKSLRLDKAIWQSKKRFHKMTATFE